MSYASDVLADSPIARFRLNDAGPVGVGSVVDSTGTYSGTPVGGITWGQPGCISDGTSNSVRFDGTSGYVTGGASLASALMNAAAWSVELWFYGGTNGTIFAAGGTTNRVRVEYFNGTIFSTSTVGGSLSKTGLIGTWHHLVITSAGLLYVDGVASNGVSGSAAAATNQLTIGARNDGTAFFGGRIAEVSLYTTALSEARILAHRAAGVARAISAGRTFYHDFEQDAPKEFPAGSDDTGQFDQGSSRTSAHAYSGTSSLSLGGATFRSMTFDNPTNQHVWAGLSEGKISFRFRYSAGTSPGMLYQITGKDRALINDKNHGIACLLGSGIPSVRIVSEGGTQSVVSHSGGTLAVDTWHEVIVRWRPSSNSPNFSLTVNGIETTGFNANTENFGALTAWHHLLIGNDLAINPTGLWIDEFKAFGSWGGEAVDITAPTVTAASINSAGDTLTVAFSEDVTGGAGFSVPGYTLGVASGSGASRAYSITPTVYSSSTPALTYAPGNVVDTATVPNALAAFSGRAITNGSTQIAPTQPTITSPSAKAGQIGAALSYTITATGTAPITFGVSGTLPAGVTFDGASTISGTPMTAGETVASITATNSAGEDSDTLTFTIAAAPTPGPTSGNLSLFNQLAEAVGAAGGHRYNLDALNAISQKLTGSAGHTRNLAALNAIAGFYIGSTQTFTLNIDALNAITGKLGGASNNTRTVDALAGWLGKL